LGCRRHYHNQQTTSAAMLDQPWRAATRCTSGHTFWHPTMKAQHSMCAMPGHARRSGVGPLSTNLCAVVMPGCQRPPQPATDVFMDSPVCRLALG
jgi:hypothetical protein